MDRIITDPHLKPSEKQLKFMDWEIGLFFHFGIRTFYEGRVDWDLLPMPASGFTPENLSCEDWCEAALSAGATYAILVTKHHDGFANWPSKYTDYSVASTPWKNGKGDVVREFTDACRKYGLKTGLYYSPAQFGSVKMDPQAYDDYFINQITELLTDYGKIDYLWFDGCGADGHEWNKTRIISVIRELQPDILLFNMWDPDTRWCDNENGYSYYPNDYTRDGHFLPDECDCRIRNQWFWSDADAETLKDVQTLLGMYELSVGKGSNLLLNVAPDRKGRICDADKACLTQFGKELERRKNCKVGDEAVSDGNCVVLSFNGKMQKVNTVVLSEDLANGQKIENVRIMFQISSTKNCLWQGSTVGHKLICRFPTVLTGELSIELQTADGSIPRVKAQAYCI